MFDVIDALEVLGADADLAGASSASLDAMLQGEGAEPALRSALLEGDAGRLEALLPAPKTVCILIHPAEEEEEEEEDEDEEDEEGKEEEEDDASSPKRPKPRGS